MTRYAIYFLPEKRSVLWAFGSRAVGYDSQSGEAVSFHEHAFYQRDDIRDLTADPRRYGFHATLKPPFSLAEGREIEELETELEAFAADRPVFVVDRLEVARLGGFLALIPTGPNELLAALAADCVRRFEPFRAPLGAADRERRLKSPLTDRQISYLDTWGYPYVLDEFRFHMTLTGRLPEDAISDGLSALTAIYAPLSQAVRFGSVCLCEQPDRESQFRLRRRFGFDKNTQ